MRERMSLSKYKSNKWTTHFARFARALLGPCSDVLREVLVKETSPFDLEKKVKSYISLKKKPSIRDDHERLVYGKDYSVFDITLLYFLFRNMCSIKPHKKTGETTQNQLIKVCQQTSNGFVFYETTGMDMLRIFLSLTQILQ